MQSIRRSVSSVASFPFLTLLPTMPVVAGLCTAFNGCEVSTTVWRGHTGEQTPRFIASISMHSPRDINDSGLMTFIFSILTQTHTATIR